jgi:hypothetical protein
VVLFTIIVVMALGTASLGVYGEYRNRQEAEHDRSVSECYNQLFVQLIRAQRERSQLADGDRQSLAELVETAIAGFPSEAERQQALAKYLSDKRMRDEAREEAPLPDPERVRCDQ